MTQTMPNKATDFLPTRRSLLSRLKRCDDQTAWQTFFDTFWKLLYSVAQAYLARHLVGRLLKKQLLQLNAEAQS